MQLPLARAPPLILLFFFTSLAPFFLFYCSGADGSDGERGSSTNRKNSLGGDRQAADSNRNLQIRVAQIKTKTKKCNFGENPRIYSTFEHTETYAEMRSSLQGESC